MSASLPAPAPASGARRRVGLLCEAGPAAASSRARLESDLLASSLFAPVRAHELERAAARDPLRALAAHAEELVRTLRFARGLELVVCSGEGASIARHAPWLRLAARLSEVPFVLHLADDALAAALEGALEDESPRPAARASAAPPPLAAWGSRLARRSLAAAPLVLVPTRAERKRLAALPGARWLPPALDEHEAPPARPTFARLAMQVEEPARLARIVSRFAARAEARPSARARFSVLLPRASFAALPALPAGWEPRANDTREERERALLEAGALALGLDGLASHGPDLAGAALALQAARAGRALLAPRSAAWADLLVDQRTGLLLEGAPEEALALAWAQLEAQPATLARLGAGARERAAAFEAAAWRARLEDWLFQLCDQGALSPTAPVWERLPGDEDASATLRRSA